jgi:hypothetical protein
MPYPTTVSGPALVNYSTAIRPDDANGFSSLVHGDPATPILRAYGGDPVRVHALVASGSEQVQTFTLGGMSFPADPNIPGSLQLTHVAVGPMEAFNADVTGGAGGAAHSAQDFAYGTGRTAFTQAGMWGLFRSMSDPACPIKPLDGLSCLAAPVPGQSTGGGSTGGGGTVTGSKHRLHVTAKSGKSSRRGKAVLTVTVANPNAGSVKLSKLRVCLPRDARFVARSTSGALRKAPSLGRCGARRKSVQLTWTGVTVPSGKLVFRFTVRAPGKRGSYAGAVSASADDGFEVSGSTMSLRVR